MILSYFHAQTSSFRSDISRMGSPTKTPLIPPEYRLVLAAGVLTALLSVAAHLIYPVEFVLAGTLQTQVSSSISRRCYTPWTSHLRWTNTAGQSASSHALQLALCRKLDSFSNVVSMIRTEVNFPVSSRIVDAPSSRGRRLRRC